MKHFTLEDREILEELLKRGLSYRSIGMRLQKSHTSVREEVIKNGGRLLYSAIEAEKRYRYIKRKRKKRRKIEISPGLKQYVIERLTQDQWSPMQISGALKIQSNGKCVISHESIYLFIYSEEGKKLKLYKHLRRKKKAQRQGFHERKKRIIIKQRTSINYRNKVINDRESFGHWETDLMIFSKQKFVMAVSVERMSRFTVATILPDKTAIEMKKALTSVILDQGQINVKSITFDNGSENVLHHELLEEYPGLETYFCDPYCSWQKGTVENTNGLLRQYFPRNIDLGRFSQQDVDNITKKLNNRPRRCLQFTPPTIAFRQLSLSGRFTP
jgi:IS30 family transposase